MGVSKTIISKHFNSQPHKEADVHFPAVRPPVCHFNSQPHKEADRGYTCLSDGLHISTHSLTRRLTGAISRAFKPGCISTHSLTRRLTL